MKIDEKNGIINIRSHPDYFCREQSGAKSNTLRVVTQDEYNIIASCLPETIMITNPTTSESFRREISSLMVVPRSLGVNVASGMVLIIISWWS